MTTGPARVAVGRFDTVVLDCPDPRALAEFYAGLLGQEVADDGDDSWQSLRGDGSGVALAFQARSQLHRPSLAGGVATTAASRPDGGRLHHCSRESGRPWRHSPVAGVRARAGQDQWLQGLCGLRRASVLPVPIGTMSRPTGQAGPFARIPSLPLPHDRSRDV